MKHLFLVTAFFLTTLFSTQYSWVTADEPSDSTVEELSNGLTNLQERIEILGALSTTKQRDGKRLLADIEVFAKAVEWMLRHDEFPKPSYADQARTVLETGTRRASQLANKTPKWKSRTGTSVLGYRSSIDGSVQPYAITLPDGIDPLSPKRWPLHVKLHGRANDMNEVNFIHRHEGKPLPEGQDWIQLDVYGRGNNAYRWAGETDVFEAIADVRRRFRIDDDRITLHGFSMGGAGAWHLGMHHPATWSSVGPGAGFVDFYKYQNQTKQRPAWQHETLGIYDSIDYALNAYNVPVCTYGGENDSQLVASTSMVEKADSLSVDIKLLVGPGMGHKFHPDSFREFMQFHQMYSEQGRSKGRRRNHIRFTTRSLRYNQCDWLTIERVEKVYEPSTVDAKVNDDGNVVIATHNISALSVSRDIGNNVILDGNVLPCYDAGEGLLPNVYYIKDESGWFALSYDESRTFQNNPDVAKRHGLQGPIDDAFMSSFVCVRSTGNPLSPSQGKWSDWTLQRFQNEFDKWMRAKIQIVDDRDVSQELIADSNLILFGDPSSNSIIRKVLPQLPVEWNDSRISIGGKSWDLHDHGLCLIYPNPLNPGRYVVINSGHTFHEKDFRASNAWLFPRLGDVAIVKFSVNDDGSFDESIEWASNFNSSWQLDP